jgi:hypothetical protein
MRTVVAPFPERPREILNNPLASAMRYQHGVFSTARKRLQRANALSTMI